MMLPKPKHVARAGIDTEDLPYEWHDWRSFDFCQPTDDAFVQRCASLLKPAVDALTIAEGEWLTFRYDKLSKDPVPNLYPESAWCADIDRHYSWPIELPKDKWQGPVRRPLLLGTILVNHPLYEVEDDEDAIKQPALMSRLIEHVLSDPTPFLDWREECLVKLEHFYPRPREENPFDHLDHVFDDEPQTILVPREIFDPEFEFTIDMAAALTDRFSGMSTGANPFLLAPEQMRMEGFAGAPYPVAK